MLKNLFSSETRIALLNRFLMHPGDEFYLRQLSGHFGLSPRLVSLELQNLQSIGLLKKRVSGNQHYYTINQQHLLFNELQRIFIKTVGLKDVIKTYLTPFEKDIHTAFIYGSLAKGNATVESDVDLMIVGDLSTRKFSGSMLKAGQELGRQINFSVFSLDEYKERLRNKDHFVTSVMNDAKIFIIDNTNELKRLVQ